MRTLAALVPNVLGFSPGQRVRIESWSRYLPEHGWRVDFHPFEDERLHEVLYRSGHSPAKAAGMLRCYLHRLHELKRMQPCDAILIFNEAALIGPAVLERIARRQGVPMIYDIDDPRFIPYRSPINAWASLLKFPGKTRALIRLADHVVVINSLLRDYAAAFNPNVTVIPNCVDLTQYQLSEPPAGPARLVWIGSLTTVSNLHSIIPALSRLQAERGTTVRLIGPPHVEVPGVSVESRPWSAETEVTELQECHIGLLPLEETPWNKWKFFFKAIQYMAVGLPVVARRMGSVEENIQDGVNGFVVDTQDEWYQRLRFLVDDEGARRQMGAAARATVIERYSLQTHVARLAALLDQLVSAGGVARQDARSMKA